MASAKEVIMTGYQRALAQAEQMAGFAAAHPSADPHWEEWLAELEKTIARTRGIKLQQQRAAKAWREAVAKRKELRGHIHNQNLPYLIAASKQSMPELRGKLRRPRANCSYRSFLTTVRRLERLIEAHPDERMSQMILEDQRVSLRTFEAAHAQVAASLREQSQASAGLRNIAAKLMRLYWNLEVIYIMALDDFRVSLKEWEAESSKIVRTKEQGRGPLRLVDASDSRPA
jgi:hypothetical protein